MVVLLSFSRALSKCSAVNIWNQSAIQLVGYSTEEVMGKVRNDYLVGYIVASIPMYTY